jgi:O-antigen/teichoic acid export membrane protein
VATLVVSTAGVGVGVVVNLVIARALGARGYGAYSWALVVLSGLAVAAAAGLDVLLLREAAVLSARGAWSQLRGMRKLAQRRAVAIGVLLGSAVAAIALGGRGVLPSGLLVPLLIALTAVPVIAIGLLQQGVAQGLHRPVAGLAAWAALRPLTLLVAVAIALQFGELSPTGAMLLSVFAAMIAATVAAITVRRLIGSGGSERPPRGWPRQARPMALTSCVTVFDAQLGLIALGILDGPRSAGLFAAATQATVGFVLVRNAAFRPLAPLMAALHDAGDHVRLQASLTRATRWVAGATCVGAIVLIALAQPLLSLFGPGFSDAGYALGFLAAAHVVNGWVAFNGTVLSVTGHQAQAARSATIALIVNAALLALLIPAAGVSGAAIAALADVAVRNLLNSRAVRRELGLRTAAIVSSGGHARSKIAVGSAEP